MAVLLWDSGFDQGALEFGIDRDSMGQIVGRDCFPGSPPWMPSNVFSIYPVGGSWVVFLADHHEWLKIGVRSRGGEWVRLEAKPTALSDDSMIRIDHGPAAYRFMFHNRGTIAEYSNPIGLWGSNLWDGFPVLPIARGRLGLVMIGLEWLAGYLRRHRWYGAAAVVVALLLAIAPAIPKLMQGLFHPTPPRATIEHR